MKTDGRFSPFLIDTLSADADENLVCAVMDVPVVATTRLESYVGITLNRLFTFFEILWLDLCEVAMSCEILSVCIIRIALWPRAIELFC